MACHESNQRLFVFHQPTMTAKLDRLIQDAKTAIETIEFAAKRNQGPQNAIGSAEWLENIAREMWEELNAKTEGPAA